MPGFFSRNIHLTALSNGNRDGTSSNALYKPHQNGSLTRSSKTGGSTDSESSWESTGINKKHNGNDSFVSNRQLHTNRLSSSQRNNDLASLPACFRSEIPVSQGLERNISQQVRLERKNWNENDGTDDWGYFVDFCSPLADSIQRKSFLPPQSQRLTPHPELAFDFN